jgi:hypothetical protein
MASRWTLLPGLLAVTGIAAADGTFRCGKLKAIE